MVIDYEIKKRRRVHLDDLLNSDHDVDAPKPIESRVDSKTEASLRNDFEERNRKVH